MLSSVGSNGLEEEEDEGGSGIPVINWCSASAGRWEEVSGCSAGKGNKVVRLVPELFLWCKGDGDQRRRGEGSGWSRGQAMRM